MSALKMFCVVCVLIVCIGCEPAKPPAEKTAAFQYGGKWSPVVGKYNDPRFVQLTYRENRPVISTTAPTQYALPSMPFEFQEVEKPMSVVFSSSEKPQIPNQTPAPSPDGGVVEDVVAGLDKKTAPVPTPTPAPVATPAVDETFEVVCVNGVCQLVPRIRSAAQSVIRSGVGLLAGGCGCGCANCNCGPAVAAVAVDQPRFVGVKHNFTKTRSAYLKNLFQNTKSRLAAFRANRCGR